MDRRRRSRTVQHVDPPPYEYEEDSESEEEEDDDDDDEEEEEEDEEEEATTATLSSPLRGEFRGDAAKRGRGSQDGVGMAPVGEDSERGEGWNREETEGLFCPICFEAWSNGGEHYPSCLPCGHLYGMSCIKKWFGLRRSRNKCPQCKTKCTMKDVRRIYGSRVLVHDDDELQKRIQSLEAKCDFLEKKDADWRRKEADLHMQLLREKTKNLGRLSDHKGVLWSSAGDQGSQEQRTGCNNESTFCSSDSYHSFVLQREAQVNGAPFGEGPSAGVAAAEFVGQDTPLPIQFDAPSSFYGPATPWQELFARFDAFSVQQTHWKARVETGMQTRFRAVDERLDAMDARMRDFFGRFPPPPPPPPPPPSGPQ